MVPLLRNSPQICTYTMNVLFNGLLAELLAILDSFFTNTTSEYIGMVGWGWWGATVVVG